VIIVAEKVKELATYQSEIKALKTTEALKDKAIVEVFLLNSSNTNSPLGLCLGIGNENCSSYMVYHKQLDALGIINYVMLVTIETRKYETTYLFSLSVLISSFSTSS
jgi:hypothetical protein